MPEIAHDIVAPAGPFPALAYSQAGRGPDVVLIHGSLVSRQDMLLGPASRLAEQFRVTAFDRPGHGESGRYGPTGSPWRQAREAHAACRALGLERPVIVGHSFGGAVALAYGQQFPEHTGGVLALAPICLPELRLEHLLFGPRALPGIGLLLTEALSRTLDPVLLPVLWRAMFLPQEVPDRYQALFPFPQAGAPSRTRADGEDAALLNAGLALTALNAFRCEIPVRVLAGDRDMVVNNRLHGAALAALLSDGGYAELPGLGHMLHHFAQDRIAETVAELAA
jgi:pimeloyl-ACP methyl ester carboxylesterase